MARLPYAPQGVVTYALKNRRTEVIIQITETEKFLWGQMDGRASLQEIATSYLLHYGSFDFEIIPTLIVKLLRADLLTMRPVSRLRAVLARNRRNPAARAMEGTLHALERLTVTSRRSHQFFERIYRYGGFLLFTPWALVVLGDHGGAGRPQRRSPIWHDLGEVTHGLASHPLVAILAASRSCSGSRWSTTRSSTRWPASTTGGGCASSASPSCTASSRPSTPTSPTSSWPPAARASSTRWPGRSSTSSWAASASGSRRGSSPGCIQGFLAASALLQLQSFLISLYPFWFLEMDGYHILVEMVGVPTLNHDSVAVRARVALAAPPDRDLAHPPGGDLPRLLHPVASPPSRASCCSNVWLFDARRQVVAGEARPTQACVQSAGW